MVDSGGASIIVSLARVELACQRPESRQNLIPLVSFQLYPVQAAEEDNISSVEDFKSPPIRTWKKFPPRTVDRVLHHPDSASTPYNVSSVSVTIPTQ